MNKECRRTLTTMLFFEIGYLRSGLIMDINHAFLSDSLRVKNKFQGHIPEILRTNFENNMCKYVLKNLCSFCGVDKKIAPLNNEQTLENQINAKIKLFIAIGHSSNGHPKIKPKLTQGEVNTSIFR